MCVSSRTEAELSQLENRQANAERHANKRGFGMSNVNERNKRINFTNAYKNVSSAPENQKVTACVSSAAMQPPPPLHPSPPWGPTAAPND